MADRERPRALQLLGPSTGGIRRHVAVLSERLRERGWSVELAGPAGVLDGLDGLDGREVTLDHVVGVPARFPPRDLRSFRMALAARTRLAQVVDGAAVVHAHGLKAGWLAASLCRRPPLVVTVHNLVLAEVSGPGAPLMRLLEGRLPARTEVTLAASRQVARRFSGLSGAGRVRVVPPVWPPPRPRRATAAVRADLGLGGDEVLVVTVARLHPQKGLDVLLDALAWLQPRLAGVRCAIVGEGPLEADLRRQVAALGLGGVVALVGSRSSAADELASADVVVIPSRWESGPLVAWEAMALGRPLVSTPVGAVPEVVVDGVSGRLVPWGDAAALAGAIEAVLADPSRAAAMGEAGRLAVEAHFDEVSQVDGIESAYDEARRAGTGRAARSRVRR